MAKKKSPKKEVVKSPVKVENEEENDLDASFLSNASNASNASRGKFEVPALTLQSCPSFERKFVVASDQLHSFKFYKLRHQRENRYALYQIDENSVAEVLRIDGERSCFYGNSVVKDGKITMLSPIHPFFLLISYVLEQDKPFTLDALTTSTDYPALQLLANIPGVLKALKLSCDSVGENEYVRNEEKMNTWLEKRFELLVQALKSYDGIPQAVKTSDESLRYYSFNIYSDYVPESLASILKFKWYIQKPTSRPSVVSENVPVKRKLEPIAKKSKSEAASAKKRKVLKEASKGTMKLASFFQQ